MPWDFDAAVVIPTVLAVLGCNLICLIVLLAARPAQHGAKENAALARSVRAALAEGIGTFVLLLACLLPMADPLQGLVAITAVLVVLAGALGGHFNPAVTLGMVLAGRTGALAGVGLVSAQLCGAIAASAAFAAWAGLDGLTVSPHHQLPVEALGTGLLVLAVAGCTADERARQSAPLCIGMALGAAGLFALPHGGGTFNPARQAVAALLTAQPGPWLACIVGPLGGAIVAGLAMRLVLEPMPPREDVRPHSEVRRAA